MAATFRFTGLAWGAPYFHFHIDEHYVFQGADMLRRNVREAATSGKFFMYGPLPVEVAFFTDGGVAWNQGQRPSFFGGQRHGVASSGVTLRVNLAGYAVGQFDIAHPVPSQGHGWVFQFNLSPGF